MKTLRENINPLIFLLGLGLLALGLWQVAPWLAYTVGGVVLMLGVCADVAVRMFVAKERK